MADVSITLMVLSVTVPAIAVHLGLYGWKRAPANRVQLTPRQWAWVVIVMAVPAAALVVLFTSLAGRLVAPGSRAGVAVSCFIALVSAIYGMAPSLREDERP